MMVMNASPSAITAFTKILDLPTEVETYADPTGSVGKSFGVNRGYNPDDKSTSPYLKLFLLGKYSFTKEDRNYYCKELRYKLNRFHVFNPIYGKKMIDMKTNEPYFPNQHLLFESYFRDFNKTHLTINETTHNTYNYNNHDDNDDDGNGNDNGNDEEYNDERYYP
jgi:hypothetical protein